MRLRKELVEKREAFVVAKYAEGWTMQQIQDSLTHEESLGAVKMNLPRLTELKTGVKVAVVKGPYIQAVCELGECTNAFTRPQKEWGQLPVCPTCRANNRARKVA